MSTGIEQLF